MDETCSAQLTVVSVVLNQSLGSHVIPHSCEKKTGTFALDLEENGQWEGRRFWTSFRLLLIYQGPRKRIALQDGDWLLMHRCTLRGKHPTYQNDQFYQVVLDGIWRLRRPSSPLRTMWGAKLWHLGKPRYLFKEKNRPKLRVFHGFSGAVPVYGPELLVQRAYHLVI